MSVKAFRWQTRIRFVDTDASQRIHYTAMFRHFEAAEMEFLREIGCLNSQPEYRDVGFPRVHVECDFSAEIRFDDLAEIEVTVERVGSSSYTLAFQTTVRGTLAAKGKVTVVCIDRQTQRSRAVPEALAEALRHRLTS